MYFPFERLLLILNAYILYYEKYLDIVYNSDNILLFLKSILAFTLSIIAMSISGILIIVISIILNRFVLKHCKNKDKLKDALFGHPFIAY